MKKLILSVAMIASMFASATQYSKLAIITAAKQEGVWDQLHAWIEASGYQDEWLACQYLSDEYPSYDMITNAIVSAGIPQASLLRVIEASKDTSVPDAVFATMYANEMKTAQGRVKWHGAVVTNIIDTTKLTKKQVHEDGYTYVQSFKSVGAMGIEQHLSVAEREAQRKAAAERVAAREAAKREARIAELTTNMTACATALAKQKNYPFELAQMLLQNELSKLSSTNTVNAVVTPQ